MITGKAISVHANASTTIRRKKPRRKKMRGLMIMAKVVKMGIHYGPAAFSVIHHHGSKDNSPTPRYIWDMLNREFDFNFDPCPLNEQGLRQFDGLLSEWGSRTFVNPPFSKKIEWVKKAVAEQKKDKLVVMLLPVDTSTSWFHDLVLPNAEVRWLRGRMKLASGKHAMYATMFCIFRPKKAVDKPKEASRNEGA
jgi:hypothetical protein